MISQNSFEEYILEVDLEYPDEWHELHNNYPLAPEKLEASHYYILSKCWSNIVNKYELKIGSINKLVPILDKKKVNMFFITKISSCIYH